MLKHMGNAIVLKVVVQEMIILTILSLRAAHARKYQKIWGRQHSLAQVGWVFLLVADWIFSTIVLEVVKWIKWMILSLILIVML